MTKIIPIMGYLVLGYPDAKACVAAAKQLADSGVDHLELGIPYSEPVADGAVIQDAIQQVLAAGYNTEQALKDISEIHKLTGKPITILTYYNLFYKFGAEKLLAALKAAGVQTILVADLPDRESNEFRELCKKNGLKNAALVFLNTSEETVRKICSSTDGFIYLVSRFGTTGVRDSIDPRVKDRIALIRKHTQLQIGVGFGISQKEHLQELRRIGADFAIIGSAFIKKIKEEKGIENYLKELE